MGIDKEGGSGGEVSGQVHPEGTGVVLQTLTDFPAIVLPVGFDHFPLTIA